MAKLRELSPSDAVTNRALDGLYATASILNDVEFFPRTGSSALVKTARQAGAKTKITRSINEDVSATPPTPNYDTIAKKIVSWSAKVDKIIEDRNEDVDEELSLQTRLESEEAGYELQDLFFSGDSGSDAEDFDGFINMVDSGQVLWSGTNGLALPLGGDSQKSAQQQAVEKLLEHIQMVKGGATHMYMNPTLKVRWTMVGKALGLYTKSIDEFGQTVERIGDVIIRSTGRKRDGSLYLPFSETRGTATQTASIYLCRWGEGTDLTALTSKGLSGEYLGRVGSFYTNQFDLDIALVLQDTTALVRSGGWKLS